MGQTFTKLFSSITESTIWCEPLATRIVWITMLAMADRKGRIFASIPGLANRARVPVEDAEKALERFLAPDRYSRTADNDGRRIAVIDGGWRLLNYEKYREMRDEEARRDYQRDWDRTNRPSRHNPTKPTESDRDRPGPTKAEAEAEAEAEARSRAGRGTRLPSDWALPSEWQLWALKQQPTWTPEHVRKVALIFYNHWTSTGRNASKTDWFKTWQNWVLKEPALKGQKGEGPRPWFLTASGIERKGVEFNIKQPTDKRNWPEFKAAVYRAAGVTDEMVRRAQADL